MKVLGPNPQHHVPAHLPRQAMPQARGDRQAKAISRQCEFANQHDWLITGARFIARSTGDAGIFQPSLFEHHLPIHHLDRAIEKFIGGIPMNPATKRFTGAWYICSGASDC